MHVLVAVEKNTKPVMEKMPLNKYIDHTIIKPTCLVSDIEKLSEELFNKSSRRVSKNKDLINYLEGFIFDKWVLSKDEIFDLIVKFKSKEQ